MCNCTAGSLGEASLLLLPMDTMMVPQTGGTLTWSAFLCPTTQGQDFLIVLDWVYEDEWWRSWYVIEDYKSSRCVQQDNPHHTCAVGNFQRIRSYKAQQNTAQNNPNKQERHFTVLAQLSLKIAFLLRFPPKRSTTNDFYNKHFHSKHLFCQNPVLYAKNLLRSCSLAFMPEIICNKNLNTKFLLHHKQTFYTRNFEHEKPSTPKVVHTTYLSHQISFKNQKLFGQKP